MIITPNSKDNSKSDSKDNSKSDSKSLSVDSLAAPQLVRRKSGRYTIRLREKGHTVPLVSLSTRTTIRRHAEMRQRELAATAKAFLLDNPEATAEDLRDHLKGIAEYLLTEPTDDYWNGIDVAWLHDAKVNLRDVAATQGLSITQQAHIVQALKVLTAGQQRVDHGNTEGLLEYLSGGDVNAASSSLTPEVLPEVVPEVEAKVNAATPVTSASGPSYDELCEDLLAERKVALKESSYNDLRSSLNTIRRFLDPEANFMSRPVWVALRDTMMDEGYAPLTINKLLTKARTVFEYALMNEKVTGRNPVERLKLTKDAVSKRRAFTEGELEVISKAVSEVPDVVRKYAAGIAMVTGARAAEVAQLTPEDVLYVTDGHSEEGVLCISINDNDGKSVKNSHSIRMVPLVSAYGFNAEEFYQWSQRQTSGVSMFFPNNIARFSIWFNNKLLPEALGDTENVCLHSLRHSMATTLKAAGVALVDAQGILGHSSQSITFDLYGRGHEIKRLSDAMTLALSGK